MKRLAASLLLNIVPLSFSAENFAIGRVAYTGREDYLALQDDYWRTHAFRYDLRTDEVLNVSLTPEKLPHGEIDEVRISDHLLLAATAVQRAMLLGIVGRIPVIKAHKQLMFWGQADEALLLSKAIYRSGLAPKWNIEVPLRYEIDSRMFRNFADEPYVGLVVDVQTANVIDVPLGELMRHGLDANGKWVFLRDNADHPYLHPNLKLLGRVHSGTGSTLNVETIDGNIEVDAGGVFLEPRSENLHEAVEALYGSKAGLILSNLRSFRQPVASAAGKLARVEATIARLRGGQFTIADDVRVTFGDLLSDSSPDFPSGIQTSRPVLLFGPQGRNTSEIPDKGIRTWGPYMYMQHARNNPLIAIVCQSRHRGRVEQFAESLGNGFPDESWKDKKWPNPYRGGLAGKFRLGKVHFEYEECAGTNADQYRAATKRLLERLPQAPDLAIVQIQESFVDLPPNENPYFVTKAQFMSAGVPTQAIFIEKIDRTGQEFPYLLNTLALASYAKLDGIP